MMLFWAILRGFPACHTRGQEGRMLPTVSLEKSDIMFWWVFVLLIGRV